MNLNAHRVNALLSILLSCLLHVYTCSRNMRTLATLPRNHTRCLVVLQITCSFLKNTKQFTQHSLTRFCLLWWLSTHFVLAMAALCCIVIRICNEPSPPPHTHTSHSSLSLRWTPVRRSLIASHPPLSKLNRQSDEERKEPKAPTPSLLKRARRSQLVVVLLAVVWSARVRSVLLSLCRLCGRFEGVVLAGSSIQMYSCLCL